MKKLNPVKKAIINRVFIHHNYSEKYKPRSKGGATRRARSSRGEALSPP
jgi:hypothetical protein